MVGAGVLLVAEHIVGVAAATTAVAQHAQIQVHRGHVHLQAAMVNDVVKSEMFII